MDFLSSLISLIEIAWAIGGFLLGLSLKSIRKVHKEHQIKSVLLLKRNPHTCFVSVPKFKTTILNRERDVAICDEVSLMLDVGTLLNSIDVLIAKDIGERDIMFDEIHIGGPVSNSWTNSRFNYYLDKIRWVVTQEHMDRYSADKNLKNLNYSFIEISSDGKEGFLIGSNFYPYIPRVKGWAILVKIIDKTDITPKTVHLLFGCGTNGTVAAVDYFSHHYSKIYKKNRKRPYIGIFEVDGTGKKVGPISWLNVEDHSRYS